VLLPYKNENKKKIAGYHPQGLSQIFWLQDKDKSKFVFQTLLFTGDMQVPATTV